MAEDMIVVSDSRKTPFIWLDLEADDIFLDPYEFRILGRIARRAGFKSTCFESIKSISEATLISRCKVISTLKKLEKKNIISIVRSVDKDGCKNTNHVTVNDKSVWLPCKKEGGVVSEKDQGSLPQRLGVVSEKDQGSLPRRHKEDPIEADPPLRKEEERFATPPPIEKDVPAPIDPEIVALGREWEAWVRAEHPENALQAKNYDVALAKVAKRKKMTPAALKMVFEFIKEDHEFWFDNGRSAARLLVKSKSNGRLKIDNILKQMETGHTKKQPKKQSLCAENDTVDYEAEALPF